MAQAVSGAQDGEPERTGGAAGSAARREVVLAGALEVFVRHGYRRTSMDDVARAAHISRPGLYFLFASKQHLFAATITRALDRDLDDVERALDETARPLAERLALAFQVWTGRYLGAVGGELSALAQAHRDVLGEAAADARTRFAALVTTCVVAARDPQDRQTSEAIATTLIATAAGLKHQGASPRTFHDDLAVAIALLLR